MSDVTPTTNKAELREELRTVLQKHLVDKKITGVMAEYFINVVVSFNRSKSPLLVPAPTNVATTS